jgi:hypothetical protein
VRHLTHVFLKYKSVFARSVGVFGTFIDASDKPEVLLSLIGSPAKTRNYYMVYMPTYTRSGYLELDVGKPLVKEMEAAI